MSGHMALPLRATCGWNEIEEMVLVKRTVSSEQYRRADEKSLFVISGHSLRRVSSRKGG